MYNVWSNADFCDNDRFLKELVTSYKQIHSAAANDEHCLDLSASDDMCIQSSVRAQPPRSGVAKIRSSESVTT